jgi:hypothetical protein
MTKATMRPLIDTLLTLVPINAGSNVRVLEISPGTRRLTPEPPDHRNPDTERDGEAAGETNWQEGTDESAHVNFVAGVGEGLCMSDDNRLTKVASCRQGKLS